MLWTEGLGVTYPGAVLALKPTAIGFDRGQFTVLLGLSGAGKSTLLRTLNHLVRPSVGRVVSAEFGDLAMGRNLRQHRRKSAMVFQHHQLIERHSAGWPTTPPGAACFRCPGGIWNCPCTAWNG